MQGQFSLNSNSGGRPLKCVKQEVSWPHVMVFLQKELTTADTADWVRQQSHTIANPERHVYKNVIQAKNRSRGLDRIHCQTPVRCQVAQQRKRNPDTKTSTNELTIFEIGPYQVSMPGGTSLCRSVSPLTRQSLGNWHGLQWQSDAMQTMYEVEVRGFMKSLNMRRTVSN